MDLECWKDEIAAHRAWLTSFDEWHTKKWEDLLSADPEAAVVEACTRHLLAEHVRAMEPAEDPKAGGPDFRCLQGSEHFYVESTCITECVATRRTGLPPRWTRGARSYAPLTKVIRNECANKARQCSMRCDAPCLLTIGTLHVMAGTLVLSGMTWSRSSPLNR